MNRSEVEAVLQAIDLQGIEPILELDIISGFTCHLTDRQLAWLRVLPGIKYVEFDYEVSIVPMIQVEKVSEVPADEEIDWPLEMLNAEEAWKDVTGAGVSIGIIDTGINPDHPDLKGAVIGGWSAFGGSWKDDHGHGTAVASRVAGRRNGVGVAGVAPDAMLYSIKVLDSRGYGSASSVVMGYQKCLEWNVRMVNMSLGSRYESNAMRDAMENVASWQGMGTICAGGNDAGTPLIYPANNWVALPVGAVNSSGNRSSFSNYGDRLQKRGCVAPGEAVVAADMDGGWRKVSGTSIASPMIAGAIALLVEYGNPDRNFMFKGSSRYTNPNVYMGHGIPDLRKMLDSVTGQ